MVSILKILAKLLVFIALLYGIYFYVNSYHKEELNKFYLQVDTWGITDVGKAEIQRQADIDALADENIPFAQREALKNKTVFLGASDKMVLLALGRPVTTPTMNTAGQQIWVYSFGDYSRPTYLYFESHGKSWTLIKAEKNSGK